MNDTNYLSTNLSLVNQSLFFNYPDYTQIAGFHLLLIIIWIIVIIVNFLGNLLIVVCICQASSLKTVTDYYIANMSLIDLVIAAVVMPFKLIQYAAPYYISNSILSTNICKITEYLFMILVFTSVFTVVIISLERYMAILYPMKVYVLHKRHRTRSIIASTWIVSMFLAIPTVVYADAQESIIISKFGTIDRVFCVVNFPNDKLFHFIWLSFVLYYALPFCVVSYTSFKIAARLLRPSWSEILILSKLSSQSSSQDQSKHQENKRKVAKMIVVIALLYYLSWTPFYVTQIIALHTGFMSRCQYFFTFLVIFLCSFLNSMANPFVYYFMSRKIRKQMIIIFRKILHPNTIGNRVNINH